MIKAPNSILIVDIDMAARADLADCLMGRGYHVTTSSPGEPARSPLGQQHFDIMLAAVGEDGQTGLE